MSFVAAAAIGGAAVVGLIGGAMQSESARKAAKKQAAAVRDAALIQRQMFDQQREDQRPWREAGVEALGTIKENKFMDNWQQDPGYEFRMREGEKAINAAGSARGLSNSGATLKALSRYGQDYSSGEYGKVYDRTYNRLSGLAGTGQNATNQSSQAASNFGAQAGNNAAQLGNAQAAGQIAQGNAMSGALNNGSNMWMQYQMMNRMFPSGGAKTSPLGSYSASGSTMLPY